MIKVTMKKILFIVAIALCGMASQAQFNNTDTLRKYINKYIRNSAVDPFTNLRLNTAMLVITKFIDSAYGGQVKRFYKTGDTIRIITIKPDTFDIVMPASVGNSNAGAGFRVLVPSSQAIKTLFKGYCMDIDSSSNANGLTFIIDSACLASKFLRRADSTYAYVTPTALLNAVPQRYYYRVSGTGLSANANVANYPATKVDSVFYKFSTTSYGTGTGLDYGGWLTSNLSGDSMKISAPFWVGIGNSLMEGHDFSHGRLHSPFDLTKADVYGQITNTLRQLTNMRFFNHGIGGQTSTQIWARWDRDVLGKTVSGVTTLTGKPQGVIIECGINDFYNGISVATLKQNLIKMAASCHREGIYCVVLTVPGDAINTYIQNRQVDEINDWLRNGGLASYKVTIVDFNRWWQNGAYKDNMHGNGFLTNDIHISAVGSDSLANFIYREAKLPKLEKIIVYTQLDPAGFTGFSRPNSINFNNTTYAISSDSAALTVTAPLMSDTPWVKINSSTTITGTSYTGISHVEYLMSYPAGSNIFTAGQRGHSQTFYPYISVANGNLGIQTENPTVPFDVNTSVSRGETVAVGPELRSYINLPGGQGPSSHSGRGGFYIILPDGPDETFMYMELNLSDGVYGPGKIMIGLGNHTANVSYDGYVNYFPPQVRIGGTGTSGQTYVFIGDSTSKLWDYAVLKTANVHLYAGFYLDRYRSYDSIKVRFTTTPIALYNSLAGYKFTVNNYSIGTPGETHATGITQVSALTTEKVVVYDTVAKKWKLAPSSALGGGGGGSVTAPASQLVYGTGSGVTSSSAAIYDGTQLKVENSAAAGNVVNTDAGSSTSGGYFNGYLKSTPTGAQGLAWYGGGSLGGSTTPYIGAAMSVYANQAWTLGSSQQSGLDFWIVATNARVRAGRFTHNGRFTLDGLTANAYLSLKAGDASVPSVYLPTGTDPSSPTAGMFSYSSSQLKFVPTGTTLKRFAFIPDATVGAGAIIQGDGAGYFTVTAIGTNGQMQRVNAGGTALEYFTPTYVPRAELIDSLKSNVFYVDNANIGDSLSRFTSDTVLQLKSIVGIEGAEIFSNDSTIFIKGNGEYKAYGATSNAIATTVYTIAADAGSAYNIEATCVSTLSDGNASYSAKKVRAFLRNSGGTLSAGTLTTVLADEYLGSGLSACTFTITTSGSNILVQVTGESGKTITHRLRVKITQSPNL